MTYNSIDDVPPRTLFRFLYRLKRIARIPLDVAMPLASAPSNSLPRQRIQGKFWLSLDFGEGKPFKSLRRLRFLLYAFGRGRPLSCYSILYWSMPMSPLRRFPHSDAETGHQIFRTRVDRNNSLSRPTQWCRSNYRRRCTTSAATCYLCDDPCPVNSKRDSRPGRLASTVGYLPLCMFCDSSRQGNIRVPPLFYVSAKTKCFFYSIRPFNLTP